MSQFTFNDYQNTLDRAQTGAKSQKVGYFRLKDGEEALVRIKCSSLDDFTFATVHKPIFGKKFEGLGTGFTPVSCLNPLGSYSDACPFCTAAASNHDTIAKASKSIYVKMLVAYKDPTTGTFSNAVPVVWERPAGYAKELATKLRDYADLSAHVFKMTRMGAGTDTRYSLDYIPIYDKPEMVPADFSAFANFDISKHSYWEKTADDMREYLATGSFPVEEQQASQEQRSPSANFNTASFAAVKAEPTPVMQAAPVEMPAAQPTPAAPQPTPTFNNTGSEANIQRNFTTNKFAF